MFHRFIAIFAVSTAVTLSSAVAPAFAEDGTVIDQAKAVAGGISPGDAPGFPITLSRPGLYVFTGNVFPGAGEDGIEVTAINVTIDLNGFMLHGRNIARVGVVGDPNFFALTVKNGAVLHFTEEGISALVRSLNISDMVVGKNGSVGVVASMDAQIRNSEITLNGADGIACQRCHVEGNTVADNEGIGVLALTGLVLGNVISGNAEVGIFADVATGYGNNTLSGNNGGGAQVTGGAELAPNACTPACPAPPM